MIPITPDVNNTNSKVENKTIEFKGLKAEMPSNYPTDLIKYGPEDLMKIGYFKSSSVNLRSEGFTNVNEILKYLDEKYPSFEEFKAENYKSYFPNMSIEEIANNYDNVVEYIEKLRGYEFAIAFQSLPANSNSPNFKSTLGILGGGPEFWYYITHQRMDLGGLYDARDIANSTQANRYPGIGYTNTEADAFRHGIWPPLVAKLGCYRYGTVAEAKAIAAGFVNSHEIGETGDGRTMDENNNEISLNYWANNATNYRKNWWSQWNVRTNLSNDDISNFMFSAYKHKLNTAQDIVNYRAAGNRTLVYLQ